MYKILAMIGIIASILAPSSSNAKICFLPGMLAGDGCLGDSLTIGNLCSDYTYTTPCPSGYDQSTCLNNGKTYYKCTCRSDAVSSELGSKYICEKSYDAECGCSPQDTVCNRDIYPYEGCGQYPGTTPSSDYCKSPKDGKIYYKSCDCSTSAYPYTCDETGLKEPSGTDYCEDVSGQTHYPFCLCEDNWTTSPCSERVDGCTELSDSIYNGLDTCYLCSAEKCPESNQLNLDYYWCASAVSDCAALGYTYTADGNCPNGSEGLKCPFDTNYSFCPSRCKNGTFDTYDECDMAGYGYCTLNPDTNCWENGTPTCSDGLVASVEECGDEDGWSIEWVDNCGRCICTDTCVDKVLPSHATAIYSSCTSCNGTRQILSDFTCEYGYEKNGNSCTVRSCEVGDVYLIDGTCEKGAGVSESQFSYINNAKSIVGVVITAGSTTSCGVMPLDYAYNPAQSIISPVQYDVTSWYPFQSDGNNTYASNSIVGAGKWTMPTYTQLQSVHNNYDLLLQVYENLGFAGSYSLGMCKDLWLSDGRSYNISTGEYASGPACTKPVLKSGRTSITIE